MRHTDDGLEPGAYDPSPIGDGRQTAADNRDLRHILEAYGLHVHLRPETPAARSRSGPARRSRGRPCEGSVLERPIPTGGDG